MFGPIFQTILERPYVLAFLIAYGIICTKLTNLRFMFLYLVIGYLIAFTSEYCSIHFGFPYGWYFYKYENLQGELLFAGVPVWDSISYVFMNFAGLCVGKMTIDKKYFGNIWTLGVSALFVTLLDVVVDPVAHRGAQWFLGDIYYYPKRGFYFDVPFSNFAGWFLVSLLINGVGIFILKFSEIQKLKWPKPNLATIAAMGLYYGVFAFGLGIAIFLQEWWLVLCDLFWIGLTVFLLYRPTR